MPSREEECLIRSATFHHLNPVASLASPEANPDFTRFPQNEAFGKL